MALYLFQYELQKLIFQKNCKYFNILVIFHLVKLLRCKYQLAKKLCKLIYQEFVYELLFKRKSGKVERKFIWQNLLFLSLVKGQSKIEVLTWGYLRFNCSFLIIRLKILQILMYSHDVKICMTHDDSSTYIPYASKYWDAIKFFSGYQAGGKMTNKAIDIFD